MIAVLVFREGGNTVAAGAALEATVAVIVARTWLALLAAVTLGLRAHPVHADALVPLVAGAIATVTTEGRRVQTAPSAALVLAIVGAAVRVHARALIALVAEPIFRNRPNEDIRAAGANAGLDGSSRRSDH